jgi:signal transduction histidine kinase
VGARRGRRSKSPPIPVGRRPLIAALVGGSLLLLAVGTALLSGCGSDDTRIRSWQEDLRTRALAVVHRDLQREVTRLFDALERGRQQLSGADDRFRALETLIRETGISGAIWEGPGAEEAWAGRPVGRRDPSSPPWAGSFRAGVLRYHQGPYLAALEAGPIPAAGGNLVVTAILETQAPGTAHPRFEHRWLDPLGIEGVDIVPHAADPAATDDGRVTTVESPEGAALDAVVELPAPGTIRDRIREERAGWVGLGLALAAAVLLVLAVVSMRRSFHAVLPRRLGLALLVLVARTLLGPLDLARRWPALGPAFDPQDFGVEDPLGWFASPADLVLTMAAILLASALVVSTGAHLRRPRAGAWRILAFLGGVLGAGAVAALHLALVEGVVSQSQTPFFDATSFIPPLPSTLLLTGLLFATAATWLVAEWGAWIATLALPPPASAAKVLLPAVAAAVVSVLFAPAWAPAVVALLIPLTTPLARFRAAEGTVGSRASNTVLLGVLATLVLFPTLWDRVVSHRSANLASALEDLVRREATLRSTARFELEAIEEDEVLREALRRARDEGALPEGIAFYLWLRSFLAEPGQHGLVTVLDAEGGRLDSFTLTPLSPNRTPAPTPLPSDTHEVEIGRSEAVGKGMRTIVARAPVRDEDDAWLGTVVFTLPEPIDLAFLGARVLGGTTGDAPATVGVRPFDLAYAILENGKVVRSSDPTIPRSSTTFGPPELAHLDAEHDRWTWRTSEQEGHAIFAPERGQVIALRRETPSPADTVLALARLVTIGVGLACMGAILSALRSLGRFRPRLQHRILLSYFAISFIPIVLLGLATAREVRIRHNAHLSERLETDIRRTRSDLEREGARVFDLDSSEHLVVWAGQRGHDVLLYRNGEVFASSRPGLVEAEVLPSRLPAEAYRATVLERRELVGQEASFAGHPVWFGYAPVLDDRGQVLATVGVPLLYDKDFVEEELAVTGNVLVAAYLFALVLVLAGGLWISRRLTRPIRLLAAGTRRVAEGEFDVVLRPEGRDDLGQLVAAFNVMTEALRDATQRAVRAERESAWRRMARQVAHEIKNPLTPIRLMIQQMQAEAQRDPDAAVEAIERTAPVVLRQIETLGRIARDFAQFARMPRRDLREVDVRPLVDDIVALHSGSVREGIVVEAEVAPDLPSVRWDEAELRRVLVNLVGNAVQAIEGEGRVTIRAHPDAKGVRSGVRIEVIDTGVGIAPEDVERIFEPDFSTKPTGTGLGLAMVKRTLDDLGGQIEVESRPRKGSTFRMWWPA